MQPPRLGQYKMSTIDITHAHTLAKDEARKRAEDLARSLESRFNLRWHWDGDAIHFDAPGGAAKGTKGEVSVTDTDVHVADRPSVPIEDAQRDRRGEGPREAGAASVGLT